MENPPIPTDADAPVPPGPGPAMVRPGRHWPGRRRLWWVTAGAVAVVGASLAVVVPLVAASTSAGGPTAAVATSAPTGSPDALSPSTGPLTHLFTRTTVSGITERVFLEPPPSPTPTPPPSPTPSPEPCPGVATSCPPVICFCPLATPAPASGSVPVRSDGPCECPAPIGCADRSSGPAECVALPTTCPTSTSAARPSCASGYESAGRAVGRPATASATGAGSVGGSSGSGTAVAPAPVVTSPPPSTPSTACTVSTVVLELSDAGAVGTADVPAALGQGGPMVLAGSGSFGAAEGSPASWVTATTGPGVAEVRLVESPPGGASPTSIDQMAPIDGAVVLAGPGDALNGASLQAVSVDGTVLSSEPVADPGTALPTTCSTGTATTTTVAPATTTTTTTTTTTVAPATTTTTTAAPTTTTTAVASTTTTAGPTSTTSRPPVASAGPASQPGTSAGR